MCVLAIQILGPQNQGQVQQDYSQTSLYEQNQSPTNFYCQNRAQHEETNSWKSYRRCCGNCHRRCQNLWHSKNVNLRFARHRKGSCQNCQVWWYVFDVHKTYLFNVYVLNMIFLEQVKFWLSINWLSALQLAERLCWFKADVRPAKPWNTSVLLLVFQDHTLSPTSVPRAVNSRKLEDAGVAVATRSKRHIYNILYTTLTCIIFLQTGINC